MHRNEQFLNNSLLTDILRDVCTVCAWYVFVLFVLYVYHTGCMHLQVGIIMRITITNLRGRTAWIHLLLHCFHGAHARAIFVQFHRACCFFLSSLSDSFCQHEVKGNQNSIVAAKTYHDEPSLLSHSRRNEGEDRDEDVDQKYQTHPELTGLQNTLEAFVAIMSAVHSLAAAIIAVEKE
jgi:hypothetical protein